jgi:uncharacterized protein
MMKEHDETTDITADDVIEYLKQNPDFFVGRDALLSELSIPHKSGSATSLVERQVAVLRERNMDMRQRLHKFVDVARDNDKLFEKTRKLTLRLLTATDLKGIFDIVTDSLNNDFHVDYFSMALFNHLALNDQSSVDLIDETETNQQIGQLLRSGNAISGILRTKELAFLFPTHGSVKSAAIAPIGNNPMLGYIAVGNDRDDYYRANMDTLFLTYISQMLALLIPHFMEQDNSYTP